MSDSTPKWNEEASQEFIDNGRYFVPERETQMQTICDLIPPRFEPFHVLELCCGEGLLAEAILKRTAPPSCMAMMAHPPCWQRRKRNWLILASGLIRSQFELGAADWRAVPWSLTRRRFVAGDSSSGWRREAAVVQRCVLDAGSRRGVHYRGCHSTDQSIRNGRCGGSVG